jgi:hypothetical protein
LRSVSRATRQLDDAGLTAGGTAAGFRPDGQLGFTVRRVEAGQVTRERPFSGRTAWVRNLETPLRSFLRTETGSAAVLLAAALVSLV